MGRTWKDKIDDGDSFGKEFPNEEEFLNNFYHQHQFIVDRLKESNVLVDTYDNRRRIRLKYFNWEQNFYPITGQQTLPSDDEYVKRHNENVGITVTGKGKRKRERNTNVVISVKKNVSKYHNFIDFVDKFISRTNITPTVEPYYQSKIITEHQKIEELKPIILDINQEIIDYLNKHPEFIYHITSRKFEELIAHIFKHFGFDVELTQATRDGGRDIIASIRNTVCSYLTFVECKHYSMDNPVGVGIIREVYGVQRIHRANKSLIVTSSYFTKDAVELSKPIANEIELKDHSDIKLWLSRMA
jgi:hypothetical protein